LLSRGIPATPRTAAAPQDAVLYKHELLSNGDFGERLKHWDTGGPVQLVPAEHAVRVTVINHAHQTVKVTPGASYRLLVRARCEQAGTMLRVQINWLDTDGKFISSSAEVPSCAPDWADYSAVFQAPPTAATGLFYLTSHTDKPVLIQRASMAY